MKAITIHQPWASLIAIGAKRFETRGWKTNYRGPIAIHASNKDPHDMMQSLPHRLQVSIYDSFYDHFNIASGALKRMPTGVIVATAILTECYEVHIDHTGDIMLLIGGIPKVWIGQDSPEANYGHYANGRYAWALTDVQRLPEPMPAKGQQGLWNWTKEGESNEH